MSILEAFLAGKEARRTADAAEQINAMTQFIGQNGQAIMGGDANALGALAGFGPQGLQMAMGIQGDVQARERQEKMDALAMEDRAYGRERDKVEDGRADQQWEMQLEEYRKGLSAEQAAAEADELENAAKMALTATSPEQWDEIAQQNGAPELVGQFDNREAVAAQFMEMSEVLKANADAGAPKSEVGKLKAELDADLAAGKIDEATYEAEFQRRAPKGSKISFVDGQLTIEEGVGVGGSAATSALTTDAHKGKMAYESLSKGLDDYEAIFKRTGGAVIPGADKDALMTARRGLQLQMKELFNLGVLNGPDLSIMDALLVDATSIENNALDAVGVADLDKRVAENLTQLRKMFKDLVEPKIKALGEKPSGDGSGSPQFDQTEIDALMSGP